MRRRSSVDSDAMRPYARLGLLVVAAIVGGCATALDESETAAKTAAALKASFRPAGQAGLDRLEQDETQRACSLAAGKAPPKDVAAMIEQTNLATIRYPATRAFSPSSRSRTSQRSCSILHRRSISERAAVGIRADGCYIRAVNRREFLHVLATAATAGFALDARAADAKRDAEAFYAL